VSAKFLSDFGILTELRLRFFKDPVKYALENFIFRKELKSPTIEFSYKVGKSLFPILSIHPVPKLLIDNINFLRVKIFQLFIKILNQYIVQPFQEEIFLVVHLNWNLMRVCLDVEHFALTVFRRENC
jgi:hypothetical protein